MFRVCARHHHSYIHLILALCIVREPTIWGFMTSKYACTPDIGRTDHTTPACARIYVRATPNSSRCWRWRARKRFTPPDPPPVLELFLAFLSYTLLIHVVSIVRAPSLWSVITSPPSLTSVTQCKGPYSWIARTWP